ncbi:hypothetical protein [Microbulbifer sp. HZ11]|uniref:hypothetical protein n=1 Tax=Microbulbifer sp. HZ11 TaxID=1453501 RepID=UPI0005BE825B|nr:hypothetical protein [Microbulbifer sp. HZ11]
MIRYFIATLLLLIASNANACSPIVPWKLIEEGLTLEEAEITSADVVFHGFLMESRTSALSDDEMEGERHYIFHVIEPFKGGIHAHQKIEVVQQRAYCSFPLKFDQEFLVYLEREQDGRYRLANMKTSRLRARTLDLSVTDDKKAYELLQSTGNIAAYEVSSTFDDGTPKSLTLTKEKQLEIIRATAERLR